MSRSVVGCMVPMTMEHMPGLEVPRGGEEEQAERGHDIPYVPYLKECAKFSLKMTDTVVSTQSAAVHEGARMDCAWSSIRSRTVHEWRPRP